VKFVFTDKKVDLPEKVHQYAEKKIGKLDRYFKTEAEALCHLQRGTGKQ
jgi:putative sigma-54 modulation protein